MSEVAKKGLNAVSRKKSYTIYQGFMDFSDGVVSSLIGDALGAALKKFGKHINVPKKNCQGKQTVIVKNQGKCFVAGTLVSTKDGLRAIETIKAGDLVYAEQPESGKIALKRVVETYIRETDTLIEVRIGKEVIKTTEEHPFWVEGQGWVNAKDLETGDVVRLQSGKTDVVLSVELIHLDHLIKVYNFQVEDFHTYFVTALKVLVHNAGCGGKGVGKFDINIKPNVTNAKLQNIIKDIYKGQGGNNTIGNGTTMDAVRNEIKTRLATNGKFHMEKLQNCLNGLQRRLRAGDLNEYDTTVTKALIQDITNALNGK